MVLTCKRCGVTCTPVEKFGLHQRLHSNVANYRFCCGFKNCNRELLTYAAFKAHAYRNHLTLMLAIHLELFTYLSTFENFPGVESALFTIST